MGVAPKSRSHQSNYDIPCLYTHLQPQLCEGIIQVCVQNPRVQCMQTGDRPPTHKSTHARTHTTPSPSIGSLTCLHARVGDLRHRHIGFWQWPAREAPTIALRRRVSQLWLLLLLLLIMMMCAHRLLLLLKC